MHSFEVIVGTYEGKMFGFAFGINVDTDGVSFCPTFQVSDADQAVRCLSVSSHGILLAGANDSKVRAYNLRRHAAVATLEEHASPVRGIAVVASQTEDAKGKGATVHYAISAAEDKKVVIWRISDWEPMLVLKKHTRPVTSVAVHPSGRCITTLDDQRMHLWDLTSGNSICQKTLGGVFYTHVWKDDYLLFVGVGSLELFYLSVHEPADEPSLKSGAHKDGNTANRLVYACPRMDERIACATFGQWRRGAETIDVIVCGTNDGVVKVLSYRSKDTESLADRMRVLAVFPVSEARVKAVEYIGGLTYAMCMSNGEIKIIRCEALTDIDVLKTVYCPGRPVSMCLYTGPLEGKILSRLEGRFESESESE